MREVLIIDRHGTVASVTFPRMRNDKGPRRAGWNSWYHCTGSTYGTWVRGDPRGWRSKGHREHVEGDYKRLPPDGKYAAMEAASKRLMKRERVVLSREARAAACEAMASSLVSDGVEVIAICVGAKHFHVLARFTPPDAMFVTADRKRRTLIGRAKGRSATALSKGGLVAPGGVWAKRCRIKPIANRAHQVRVTRYIPAHRKKGAAVRMFLRKST
jgi:REP element-mobilizing transposase RayT